MGRKAPAGKAERMIVDVLASKAGMKQDVHARTKENFGVLTEELERKAHHLQSAIAKRDPRLKVEYAQQGDLTAKIVAAGDTVVFSMHSNIFRLDQSNAHWRSGYLREDEQRGYFGVINIYNFLSDSFRFDRERDLGYLVARLFINKEGHYFVQGRKQLGFLFNDLAGSVLDREAIKRILDSVLLHVLDFDLLAPPYDQVSQVSVQEMKQVESHSLLSTGKRLGFRFQADSDEEG